MYAIFETGGKQYKAEKGDILQVEKLEGEAGDQVEFSRVLLIKDDKELKVGNPFLEGAKVIGRIRRQGRGRKIIVFKYRRRKNYRRKQGHRQYYTWVEVEDIVG